MKIRAFIAIEVNKNLQSAIKSVQDTLKVSNPDVKWVNPKNIHLTLKFLGDIKKDRIEGILDVMNQCLNNVVSFNIELTQLGTFPENRSPRILWIGIGSSADIIKDITMNLEEALGKIGFKKEKREFTAHITIGRVRSPKNISALNKAIQECHIPPKQRQPIEKVTLFQSTLTSQNPIYEALGQVKLISS